MNHTATHKMDASFEMDFLEDVWDVVGDPSDLVPTESGGLETQIDECTQQPSRMMPMPTATPPSPEPTVDVKNPLKRELNNDSSGEDCTVDAATMKRLKRMQRNRVSAASSRERKRAHIEGLEHKVATLNQLLQQLQQENAMLRKTYGALSDSAERVTPDDSPALDLEDFLQKVTGDEDVFATHARIGG